MLIHFIPTCAYISETPNSQYNSRNSVRLFAFQGQTKPFITLFPHIQQASLSTAQKCKTLSFGRLVLNHQLTGPTLGDVLVSSADQCTAACFAAPRCSLYNVRPENLSSPLYKCELLENKHSFTVSRQQGASFRAGKVRDRFDQLVERGGWGSFRSDNVRNQFDCVCVCGGGGNIVKETLKRTYGKNQ